MKILILGGTIFVGRHLIDAAQAKGHKVTIFHRGNHPLPEGITVEEILGDRNTDLDKLSGRSWDVVIDTCGYTPEVVRRSCEALRSQIGRYLFVSTISVYADLTKPGTTEESELAVLSDPAAREITGETYGALKVLCENEVHAMYGDAALIVRPGLIVGPNDPTGRFTYWPVRIAEGGEVLAPGNPEGPVQCVDVRDLTAFMIQCIEADRAGTVHVTGPANELPMAEFVELCKRTSASNACFVWVDEEFLLANGAMSEYQIPVWLPADYTNLNRMDLSKALRWGLALRQMATTISDTLAWATADLVTSAGRGIMTREKESELLATFAARKLTEQES